MHRLAGITLIDYRQAVRLFVYYLPEYVAERVITLSVVSRNLHFPHAVKSNQLKY